ncbi:MAG: 1,4-alpha-glucan branching protein GlgB [Clostridiales Family XIII bacterium]|jgi:1,4-alpha-glucan branching enzyme|nr:1,4-alpha-glucan branching protein GlgB [Clostridiales Family XIII bacterium]
MTENNGNKLISICGNYDEEITRFYAGDSIRAYDFFGCRYIKEANAHLFAVWAPNARTVSVVGDFNEWDENADPMEQYRGAWVRLVPGLEDGDNYKFRIIGADGKTVYKADPYAYHAERAPETASKVWSLDGYKWGDRNWMSGRVTSEILKKPVSIYEMHLGSWRVPEGYEYPSFRETAAELAAYVKGMGYTHVELMPVNEYPFDGSWGYQVTGFYAITSRFGTPQDFMYFVDTLHKAGIGVLVDWVPSGFPKDAHGPAHFDGTWLYEHQNPIRREHPHWGTNSLNYARPEVVSFLVSSAMLLIDKYHLDGIRVDAVSSILYLDYGRDEYIPNKDGGNIDLDAVEFLKKFNTAVMSQFPGTFTVAEESTAFPLVTKPPHDGGLGFVFKWNMGFMNDTLGYMKTDPYFRHGNHDKMTFSMHYAFSENYILAYSHDEVVHGKASLIGKMAGDYDDKFASLRTLFGWLFAHPGKKLMFMGDEFAQFIEWNYKQELDWPLLTYDKHRDMKSWVAALNGVYQKRPALHAADEGWNGFTWLNVEDRKNSVFAFIRGFGEEAVATVDATAEATAKAAATKAEITAEATAAVTAEATAAKAAVMASPEETGRNRQGNTAGDQIICIFNFTPVAHDTYDIALPRAGELNLILNSDDPRYGGAGVKVKKRIKSRAKGLNGFKYTATLTLPPMSVLYYSFRIG